MIKLIEFYRFLRCFAVIRISGGFPERFLNLCNREKIYLWDTLYENGAVTAKIYCKDFYRLRKIRSKSGVSIKIISKNGLTFSYRHNKKRKVLIYGLAVSLIFMSIMNLFVWCIDVKESQSISKHELLSAAETLGLKFGTFVPLFDENKVSRDAVNMFNGRVIWAATNIKGSKATLEVREHTVIESDEKSNPEPCNIIADFDGVIVSSEVYSGTGIVSRGSAVKTGDLLVSGISENTDGSVNFHTADGKLTAFHKQELEGKASKPINTFKLAENKEHFCLNLFSLKIPLSLANFGKNYADFQYTEFLNLGTKLLPFGYSVGVSTNKISEKSNTDLAVFYVDEFTEKEYSTFRNTLLISSDYTFFKEKDGYYIKAEYDCIDFIGKKNVILQEN